MTYAEAKEEKKSNKTIFVARVDGEVWSAGRMVDVGEVIGYYATEAEAKKACEDYELFDFDKQHLCTSVEICDDAEFEG